MPFVVRQAHCAAQGGLNKGLLYKRAMATEADSSKNAGTKEYFWVDFPVYSISLLNLALQPE